MRIIEQNLVGKHSQETCEDGIVTTPDFIAVIDGSTSKTSHRFRPEMKNGRLCMRVVSDYVRHMPTDITLEAFCEGVTAAVHTFYPVNDILMRTHPEERLCASAVIYSNHRKEIWMVGDCQCMIGGQLYENAKPYEELIAKKRATIFEEALRQHPDMVHNGHIVHDYARDAILPDLVKSMKGENITYAVIDGFPIYKKGIRRLSLLTITTKEKREMSERPLSGRDPSNKQECNHKDQWSKINDQSNHGQGIVLASDGYPFLKPTLKESEDALNAQLRRDPYNIHTFLATKGLMEGNLSFDDRAYISFQA